MDALFLPPALWWPHEHLLTKVHLPGLFPEKQTCTSILQIWHDRPSLKHSLSPRLFWLLSLSVPEVLTPGQWLHDLFGIKSSILNWAWKILHFVLMRLSTVKLEVPWEWGLCLLRIFVPYDTKCLVLIKKLIQKGLSRYSVRNLRLGKITLIIIENEKKPWRNQETYSGTKLLWMALLKVKCKTRALTQP